LFDFGSFTLPVIIIISVGSCDTEDWTNDVVNSALITGIN